MKKTFDPEALRAQIDNLRKDRDRVDRAIEALEEALRSMEALDSPRTETTFNVGDVTLHDAVKRTCMAMIDGITRQRVIESIEGKYPALRPKSASVAAALVNLTKGDHPLLRVAIEGTGRSPSFYSTQGDTIITLGSDEIEGLLDENATRGTGGWQSLWLGLQRRFDRAKGTITLTPELRARIYHYYRQYGEGGWQTKVRRVFRREMPHLFT